ncbi:hypothetical protein BX661DRAFT_189124 [Kickxella alabastrina]|uniref:uncharacterized protein n=1 Tax=Kickxella alabastrina TaxID=61397 RepID=UPI002220E8D2|nr:uncharacterized protein BX661DRAFT_189124 [Kickxella alabastrina]KAI7820475.1 hypothetical protein BX661DRAFT_189124 [Kickxella alabastrina]
MSASNKFELLGVEDVIAAINERNKWAFVVSSQWIRTIQTLSIISLISSLCVLTAMAHIFMRHKRYLARLSIRVSGCVAVCDILSSITQLLLLQNNFMNRQSTHGLRFILWLSMFSTLSFVFLTLSISTQLHLSTLTKVRVATYMRLEKFYVPLSLILAAVFPAIAVVQMKGIYWVPHLHAFNWPSTTALARRLVLWMCNYLWIVLTIVYCAGVALVLSLRIWSMWRDSVDVISEPRMPEKWDWNSLIKRERPSQGTMASSSMDTLYHHHKESAQSDQLSVTSTVFNQQMPSDPSEPAQTVGRSGHMAGSCGRGYLVTMTVPDRQDGQPVVVRSYVDKSQFLRSIQRLVCYPLVPVLTQLGVVAMNMTEYPSKNLYIFGTVMATTSGLLNFLVFTLNPALPDIWKQDVRDSL